MSHLLPSHKAVEWFGQPDAAQSAIVLDLRLPRALCSVLTGAALAVAGLLYQGLFRNPLADSYVIGASGGAALGAAISFLLPGLSLLGFGGTACFAFTGSLLTVLAVYAIARVNGRAPVVSLLLAGFAVSQILGFAVWFVTSFDQQASSGMRSLALWLHGAVSTPTFGELATSAILILIAYAFSIPMSSQLNTLSLGDDSAQSLGLRLELTRASIVIVGSLLTGVAVCLGGIIGFVGLIVPHFLRLLCGPDHRQLLPLCALAGGLFLLIADTLARTVLAPTELPVGILTAFIGGPAFLYLLRKSRREWRV